MTTSSNIALQKPHMYNNPASNDPALQSTIGFQKNKEYYTRQILIDLVDRMIYSTFGTSETMPKGNGKIISKEVMIPLLDDRNVNDQGIDKYGNIIPNGNFFGSSRDFDTIEKSMPTITELGGRVNRVGFKRTKLSSSFYRFGFFTEFSKESIIFDSHGETLLSNAYKELISTANTINELCVQRDIVANANTIVFPGTALRTEDIGAQNVISYRTFLKLEEALDKVYAPMSVSMCTGSQLIDTRTIPDCRYLIAPREIRAHLETLTNLQGQPAFIPVHQYAAGTTVHPKEIGSIHTFRIIVDDQMLMYEGKGQLVQPGDQIRSTNGRANVYNILCLTKDAFATINFQYDHQGLRFKTNETGFDISADDPFGSRMLMSIQWWYGFLPIRPEFIGLIQTALPTI